MQKVRVQNIVQLQSGAEQHSAHHCKKFPGGFIIDGLRTICCPYTLKNPESWITLYEKQLACTKPLASSGLAHTFSTWSSWSFTPAWALFPVLVLLLRTGSLQSRCSYGGTVPTAAEPPALGSMCRSCLRPCCNYLLLASSTVLQRLLSQHAAKFTAWPRCLSRGATDAFALSCLVRCLCGVCGAEAGRALYATASMHGALVSWGWCVQLRSHKLNGKADLNPTA